MSTPAQALSRLISLLDELGASYFVGGSVASSVYGEPRATRDVDLVADLRGVDLEALARGLQPEFYADAEAMADCVRRGRAFNVIHIPSSYKFDVFPLPDEPYSKEQLKRKSQMNSAALGAPMILPLASPEDTLLAKLAWFRSGGEVSERQWNDLLGIVTVQRGRLDLTYLRHWAATLGLSDLLERLMSAPSA